MTKASANIMPTQLWLGQMQVECNVRVAFRSDVHTLFPDSNARLYTRQIVDYFRGFAHVFICLIQCLAQHSSFGRASEEMEGGLHQIT